MNGSARYTRAGHNKSFDASGITEFVIDNLSVTWVDRRRVNSDVMPRRFLKNRERAMLELVVAVAAIARDR